MTNYERIKAMSVDEMADFFVNKGISCIELFRRDTNNALLPCPVEEGCTSYECFKQWLESEAENDR